ncbi:MAG TPA: TetR/AcrR family transcriptional regulator [Salinivirga sp.]|uniref:TetR/AcrR family transcriptional regulator n=1 Tax=Salinivirga sp. TaxID=1970192 RepID=UPI002B465670|nr:TetR/AcrR family transcriptional regulator [Salinivirga sp.]HKK60277.1 TetR/AcrR family transcriptional regulator [Salinivirga sp.]
MKQKIANKAKEMFLRFGYSKITLSEVSAEMGISKKTIYNHFESKDALLYYIIDQSRVQFENEINEIETNTDQSFRDMVMQNLSLLGIWVSDLRTFTQDLAKNHPEAKKYLNDIRKDVIIRHAMRIMEKGKKQGLLDNDARSALALFIFLATAEKVSDTDYHKDLPAELTAGFPANPADLFQNIIEIIYQGIKK